VAILHRVDNGCPKERRRPGPIARVSVTGRKYELSNQTSIVKERPILFSAPMVKAILEGRKTQTRRIVKLDPPGDESRHDVNMETGKLWPMWDETGQPMNCPFGVPGDELWVRETWCWDSCFNNCYDEPDDQATEWFSTIKYRADGGDELCRHDKEWYDRWCARDEADEWNQWRPSIHMPRWASRISLVVKSVRVERLQDISQADAISEGFSNRAEFLAFIRKLNDWPDEFNPWLWVVGFQVVA